MKRKKIKRSIYPKISLEVYRATPGRYIWRFWIIRKDKTYFSEEMLSLHIPHAFNFLSPIKATGHTCVPSPTALVMFTLNAKKTKPSFCLPSSCSEGLASVCKLCFACTKIMEVKLTEGMLGVLVLLSASPEPHSCKAFPVLLRLKEAMGSTLKS